MKDICLVQKDQKVEGNLLKILVQQYPLQLNIYFLLPPLLKTLFNRSDKNSIVELLKDHSYRCNRSYSDCVIYSLPTRRPRPSQALCNALKVSNSQDSHSNGSQMTEELNPDFVQLEKEICQLILRGNLHWRHFEMAVGMLFSLIVPGYQVNIPILLK